MYEDGKGLSQDYVEAAKWYRKAAERGNVDAQSRYEKIQHGTRRTEVYLKAAEQGDAMAQVKLAHMFRYGKGSPLDGSEAAKW